MASSIISRAEDPLSLRASSHVFGTCVSFLHSLQLIFMQASFLHWNSRSSLTGGYSAAKGQKGHAVRSKPARLTAESPSSRSRACVSFGSRNLARSAWLKPPAHTSVDMHWSSHRDSPICDSAFRRQHSGQNICAPLASRSISFMVQVNSRAHSPRRNVPCGRVGSRQSSSHIRQ